MKVAPHGWLMPRGRPSAEAADEAEVESVLRVELRQAAPWPTVSVALGAGRLGFAGIRPGLA